MPKVPRVAAEPVPVRRPMHRGEALPRCVLVTGGAQGIGRRVCERFLASGWRVVVLDRDAAACRSTAREIASPDLRVVAGDVGRERDVARAVAQAVAWGGGLDALIANAGIEGPRRALDRVPLEEWQRVIATNLTGVFLGAKHAAPHLRARRGAIVTVASTRALQSEPDTFAYSASKGGVVALTHALAVSLGPAVRANCISPGWIAVEGLRKPAKRQVPELRVVDHAQHPAGRVGSADDVAELAYWLCSPAAGFITGANIVCDGGMTRKMIYAG